MNAQEKMMNRFADALIELLKTKQLYKITVTDIALQCNVTRQIFYRYFEDKIDLIAYICKTLQENCIRMNKIFEWEVSILSLLNAIYNRKEFYQHAVISDNNDTLYNILYNHTVVMYRNIIEYRTQKKITPDLDFLLELYCRGGIGLLVKWIGSGMKMPCEKLKDLFLEGMPERIRSLLTNYEVPIEYILPDQKDYNCFKY